MVSVVRHADRVDIAMHCWYICEESFSLVDRVDWTDATFEQDQMLLPDFWTDATKTTTVDWQDAHSAISPDDFHTVTASTPQMMQTVTEHVPEMDGECACIL